MKKFLIAFLFLSGRINAQPYTSFFTGDASDVNTTTSYGICLMGGATENDDAMRWFLNKSGGGDVVVIRATGSNGYNSYLYSQLGVSVNSVETLVIPSSSAANDVYVEQQIRNAEAIFIAGGNQANYVNFWKNTKVDSAINYLINIKKVPIGGTSAGMAILGQNYYSALGSSITSSQALANPFNANLTLGFDDFFKHKTLRNTITDTHFDNPDRRGRLVTFLARMAVQNGTPQFAIACDEYTAVCIEENGIAKVYGGFPAYDDNAYFISTNCEVANNTPEVCIANTPLTWNKSNQALKVYRVKGNTTASNSFNLNNYKVASGGTWQHWFVNNGVFGVDSTTALEPTCNTVLSIRNQQNTSSITPINSVVRTYPNPFKNEFFLQLNKSVEVLNIYNTLGCKVYNQTFNNQQGKVSVSLSQLPAQTYICEVIDRNNKRIVSKILKL